MNNNWATHSLLKSFTRFAVNAYQQHAPRATDSMSSRGSLSVRLRVIQNWWNLLQGIVTTIYFYDQQHRMAGTVSIPAKPLIKPWTVAEICILATLRHSMEAEWSHLTRVWYSCVHFMLLSKFASTLSTTCLQVFTCEHLYWHNSNTMALCLQPI